MFPDSAGREIDSFLIQSEEIKGSTTINKICLTSLRNMLSKYLSYEAVRFIIKEYNTTRS